MAVGADFQLDVIDLAFGITQVGGMGPKFAHRALDAIGDGGFRGKDLARLGEALSAEFLRPGHADSPATVGDHKPAP